MVATKYDQSMKKAHKSRFWSLSKMLPNICDKVQYQAKNFYQSVGNTLFTRGNSNEEVESLRNQIKLLQEKIETMTVEAASKIDSENASNLINLENSESEFAKRGLRLLSLCDKVNIEKERILEGNRTRKINNQPATIAPQMSLATVDNKPRSQVKSVSKGSVHRVHFKENVVDQIHIRPPSPDKLVSVPMKPTEKIIEKPVQNVTKLLLPVDDKENSTAINRRASVDSVLDSKISLSFDPRGDRRSSINSVEDLPIVEPKKLFASDVKRMKWGPIATDKENSRHSLSGIPKPIAGVNSKPKGLGNQINAWNGNVTSKPSVGSFIYHDKVVRNVHANSSEQLLSHAHFAME